MLSPNQLERATPGYRRGYNDAINRRPSAVEFTDGIWERDDYAAGYRAAVNDLFHAARNRRRNEESRS